jgi:hypothetical protein
MMMQAGKTIAIRFIVFVTAGIGIGQANAKDYFVAKTGKDTFNCADRANACLTIQKGVSMLAPGDTLNIGSGVYQDDGGSSAFNTSSSKGFLSQTGQGNISTAAVVIDRSGTETQPITIQGDPENTVPAIIDCGHVYQGAATYMAGIFMNRKDYITFKNFTIRNCMSRGIYDMDRGDNSVDVPDLAKLSVGVVIDGLTIYHIGGADNDSGIGMWSTKDWIVRNTHIYEIYGWPPNSRVGNAIMTYGTVNALIEHNHIQDSTINPGQGGVFWKDHYVQDAVTRLPVFESEIRYNLIDTNGAGVAVGVQPDNEAGENYIHHNIIIGAGGFWRAHPNGRGQLRDNCTAAD